MARPGSILDKVQKQGFGETIAQSVSGGRDLGQRVFYNNTRAGLLNPNVPPDDASPYGGIGQSLKSRREENMRDAERISDAVPRTLAQE